MSDGGGDKIPSIEERLSQLRPSRELLEYYRKKVAQFDDEHEDMIQRMEKYKVSYEDQQKMELELSQREQEIVDLQKAISDLQVCVLQEREQVLRLYAENDRLKIREINDKKKIQHLLAIAGPAASEVSYFHKEPPSKIAVPQVIPKSSVPNDQLNKNKKNKVTAKKAATNKKDDKQIEKLKLDECHTLSLQVEALQHQLEEQVKLSRDQNTTLLEERRLLQEENELQRERDNEKFDRYSERLKQVQALLHDSTQNVLNLKREHRRQEKEWLGEKDKLLQEMDKLRDAVDKLQTQQPSKQGETPYMRNVTNMVDYVNDQETKAELDQMSARCEQAAKLAELYREQCIEAENELARVREETDVHKDVFTDRTGKMAKRLKLMTVKYAALEKRRSCEVEGFQTDIKLLRKRLKEVEKQLYRVTVGGMVSDVEMLQVVKKTSKKSNLIQSDLKNLKSKLYTLEGDLRNIY